MLDSASLNQHSNENPVLVWDKSAPDLTKIAPRVRELSRLKPWRGIATLTVDWGMIVGAMAAGAAYPHPLVIIAAWLVIASRQHGLAILMHDAAHHRLWPDRQWNDRLSNWLLAYPVFLSTEAYRKSHLAHHVYLNTDKDPDWMRKKGKPDWTFPKSRMGTLWVLIKTGIWGGTVETWVRISRYNAARAKPAPGAAPEKSLWGLVLYYVIAAGIITALDLWGVVLLFWVVPYLTVTGVLLRIRSIAEHFGLEWASDLTMSRSTDCALWERVFITPHYVHYHLEHHLFPSVPFYHLPQLRNALHGIERYRREAHETKTYFGRGPGSMMTELVECKAREPGLVEKIAA